MTALHRLPGLLQESRDENAYFAKQRFSFTYAPMLPMQPMHPSTWVGLSDRDVRSV